MLNAGLMGIWHSPGPVRYPAVSRPVNQPDCREGVGEGMDRERVRRRGEFQILGSDVPPPFVGGWSGYIESSDRAHGRAGERRLPPRLSLRKVAVAKNKRASGITSRSPPRLYEKRGS